MLFEDGQQRRDFASVHDVVRACLLALERPAPDVAGRIFNVGSGESRTIAEATHILSRALAVDREPIVTRQHRPDDVRHCFADVTHAADRLGYRPCVGLDEGLREFARWFVDASAEVGMPGGPGTFENVG